VTAAGRGAAARRGERALAPVPGYRPALRADTRIA